MLNTTIYFEWAPTRLREKKTHRAKCGCVMMMVAQKSRTTLAAFFTDVPRHSLGFLHLQISFDSPWESVISVQSLGVKSGWYYDYCHSIEQRHCVCFVSDNKTSHSIRWCAPFFHAFAYSRWEGGATFLFHKLANHIIRIQVARTVRPIIFPLTCGDTPNAPGHRNNTTQWLLSQVQHCTPHAFSHDKSHSAARNAFHAKCSGFKGVDCCIR